jgi:hypothetical protein
MVSLNHVGISALDGCCEDCGCNPCRCTPRERATSETAALLLVRKQVVPMELRDASLESVQSFLGRRRQLVS